MMSIPSLRDRIATEAMSALLSGPAAGPDQTFDEYADEAYRMADAMLSARGRSYEKLDENRRVLHTLKPGCEVTNEPVSVIVARLKTLADDERIWRMPAKFQWTMLQSAWLLEKPILTDDERESLRKAAEAFEQNDDDIDCDRIARTIRKILERLP